MIVTADPHGDFNATSQILRYSALAREITVPRIPSVTQTILTAAAAAASAPAPEQCSNPVEPRSFHSQPFSPAGSRPVVNPHLLSSANIVRELSPMSSLIGDGHRTTMEAAALEIARLSEDVDYLRQALDEEQSARQEAESHLLSMEDRMIELEQVIREECTAEFERRLEIEMARWRATLQVEMERGEEHWGRKIEVFERSMGVAITGPNDEGVPIGGGSDDDDKENVLLEDVNEENERLRRENDILRREVSGMSPTKRHPLQERGSDASVVLKNRPPMETGSPRPLRTIKTDNEGTGTLRLRLEKLRVSDDQASVRSPAGSVSPKKMRRLATKRWNAVGDDDDLF